MPGNFQQRCLRSHCHPTFRARAPPPRPVSIFATCFFFSPTATALGSSTILKVSGQNCFRTLCGSLGQIRLGPPKGSAEGSTKVPARVHQGSTKVLLVSWSLWFSGAAPSWAAKRFRLKRSCGRFTKVPPRFHEVPPRLCKFRVLSGLLGQIRFGCQKVLWKVPPSLL